MKGCSHRDWPPEFVFVPNDVPVTLWVNRESRDETLRNSHFLGVGEAPMLINSQQDSIFIIQVGRSCDPACELPACELDGTAHRSSLSWTIAATNEGILNVNTLEVKNMELHRLAEMRISPHSFDKWFSRTGKLILGLKALKTLVLTNEYRKNIKINEIEEGRFVESWLNKQKGNFDEGEAPTVFIRNWSLDPPAIP
jgi:hypothetical protein